MDSTIFFGGLYNTLTASSDTRNVMPGGNATLGLSVRATVSARPPITGARARGTQAHAGADGGCRDRMGNDPSEGRQYRLHVHWCQCRRDVRLPIIGADRQFENTAPELALLYKLNSEWQFRGAGRHRLRHAAGRQSLRAAERSVRQQHRAQDADQPRLRPRRSTGRRTMRSSSARPASTNSSTTNWCRRPPTVGAPQCELHVQCAEIRASRRRTGR